MSVRTLVKSIQNIMRQDTGVDGDAQRISQLCWMFFLKIIDDQDQELELMRAGYKSPIPKRFQWRNWAADPEGVTGEALLTFINGDLFPALKNLRTTGQSGNRSRVVRDVFEDAYNYMKSGQLMRQIVNRINDVDFNNLTERQHFGDIYEQILNDLQSAGNAGEYYTPRAVTAFMADRIDPKPGETLFDPACGTGGFLTCSLRHMRKHYVKRPSDERKIQAALRAVEKKQLPHMLCVTNMLLHGIEDPSFVRHDNTLARPYIGWEKKDRVDIVLTNPPFGGKEEDGIESNFPQHFRTKETADLFLALIVRLLKPSGRAAMVLPDGSLFGEGIKTRLKEHLMEECNLHTIVRLPNSVFRPYASIGTNLLFFEKGDPTQDIWFYEHQVPEGQKAYSMTRPIRLEHLQGCIDWWGGIKREGREETERAWKVTADDIKARGYNLDIKNPHTVADNHGDPEELLAELNRRRGGDCLALRESVEDHPGGGVDTMNADQLLTHYEQIADAPDAIPRLRRFVLDLAVRGKLVEQDPNDEPAAISLVEGKQRKLQEVRPADILGWLVAPVGLLLEFQYGKGMKASERLDKGPVPVFGSNGIVGYCETPLTQVPSIIVGRKGSAGALNLCNGPSWTTDVAYFVEAPDYFDLRYLVIGLQTLDLGSLGKGVKPGLSRSEAYTLSLSMPPLAEQRRIVTKVDELMTLCDKLEAARTEREITRDRLAAASLARLNAPAPDPETFQSHAAFALDNLAPLTARPDQIKALRQTILNLAVRGKLVEQDPNDEPVEQLLVGSDERRNETAGNDHRASKSNQPLLSGDDRWAVANTWRWCGLADLVLFVDYRGKTPAKISSGIRLLTAKNVRKGMINLEPAEFLSESEYHKWMTRGFPKAGDVLFTTEAPMGNAAVIELTEQFALAQRVICFQSYGALDPHFLVLQLLSEPFQFILDKNGTGMTAKGIKASKLKQLPIVVPPLAEQHRIVAKVNELMSLCDRLEASLTTGADTRCHLLDALLKESFAPA